MTARAFWLLVAKSLAFTFGFALPLLLVRRLSQTEFGLYKQVFLVVGTAISLLPLGFGMSAYYFLPRETEPRRRAQVVFNILLFNAVVGGLACAVLVFSPQLLGALFNSAELTSYAPLIGFVILFWITSTFLETVAVANQETGAATIFIIGAQLTKTVFLLAAAVLFGTVLSLIYAALIHSAIQAAILVLYLNSRFRGFWRGFDPAMLRRQLAYALPFGGASLLFVAQIDLHHYFISNQFGAADYAIYAIGCFQLPLVGILSESVTSVMIPRVSLLQKQDDRREIIRLIASVARKLAFVYFPLYAFLMITGREFIAFLFTPQYSASWPVFAINLTLVPVYIIVLDPVLRAYAEERYYLLRLRTVLSLLMFAALWFWTARLGLTGVIAVVVAVKLVENLMITIRSCKVVGVTRRDLPLVRDVGKLALATLAAAAVALALRFMLTGARPFIILAACGALFASVYLAAVFLLAVPTAAEREALWRKLAVWQRFGGRTVEPAA